MPNAKDHKEISQSRDKLLKELESLDRLIRHHGQFETGTRRGYQERVVALARLCRDLPLDEWEGLLKDAGLKQWMAFPINGEAFPFLAHLQDRLEELSYQTEHDPLTGLLNRRAFDHLLGVELSRANREGYHLTLAILDVDNFKRINDTHGHPCGDEVLTALARTLRENKRSYDVAARIGGEEFAVILPSAGPNRSQAMLERVLSAFRGIRFECGKGEDFNVSFSAGMAHCKGKVRTRAKDFVALADKALYMAKEQGKNRIVLTHVPDERLTPKATMVKSEEKRFLFSQNS